MSTLTHQEKKKAIQDLLATPGWNMVITILQEQTDALQQQILFAPVTSQEDIYTLERAKGKLEGRLALTRLVETLLESLEFDQRVEGAGYVETDV